ncbi:MAG: phytanoyl-CoA dioxygenase family protein [Proteobacteria bacterium]|nr:phytanoyl-CoA dioxygenase family protein [Pseudomonadota bacterium]
MNRLIGESEIEAYRRDGVVVLRGAVDAKWIDTLRVAVEKDLVFPGPHVEVYTKLEDPGLFFNDFYMFKRIPEFREFALNGPGPEIAAQLMGAAQINLFFDHLFVKEPGTRESRVPWHQDQPYMAVNGEQFCSMWVPLDPISEDTMLEFVRGSHRWGKWYAPFDKMRDGSSFEGEKFEKAPDIDKERDAYDIVSWTLEPGDCLVFQALLLHQGKANLTATTRRRAIVGRYLGDDATYSVRVPPSEFPHQDPAIADGELMRNSPDFPKVWPRSEAGSD